MFARRYNMPPREVWAMTLADYNAFLDDAQGAAQPAEGVS